MRTLATICLLTFLYACGNKHVDDKKEEVVNVDTLSEDDPYSRSGVLIFDPELMDEDYYKEIEQVAIYSDPEGEHTVDSLSFFFHHFETPGITINETMCDKRDLFTYYREGKRHYGLIYTASIDPTYHILEHTLGESSWIDQNEMPQHWLAVEWDSISKHVDLNGVLFQPSKSQIVYEDSLLSKRLSKRLRNSDYARIAIFTDSIIGLVQEEIHYEQLNYGGYEKKVIRSEDTIWMPLLDKRGRLSVEFVQEPPQWGLYNRGTGVVAGEFNVVNRFARKPYEPAKDSIPLYGNNKRKILGAIPLYGGEPYIYGSYILGKDTAYQLRWTGNYEWFAGLTSIEGMRVYDEDGKYIKLIKEKYLRQDIWLDVNDLGENYEYYNWNKYFKRFPNGNEGWTHGYAWVGKPSYVYAEPNYEAKKVLELPSNVEIYLTGNTEDEWAEVQVKEVYQTFGEIYYQRSKYYHQWKGWVKMTNNKGWPNLDEIILGC